MAIQRREMKRVLSTVWSNRCWVLLYLVTAVWVVYMIQTPPGLWLMLRYIPTDTKPTDCKTRQELRKQLLSLQCSAEAEARRGHRPMYITSVSDPEKKRLFRIKAFLKQSQALVLEKEKAIFCFIPKVACSSWKTKILENRGVIHPKNYTGHDALRHNEAIPKVLEDYGVKMLSQYDPSTAYHMLNTYYKYMFVRDPFERLLSAYRDKIGNPNNEHYRATRERLLKYRNKNSDEQLIKDQDSEQVVPSFTQFLESLLRKPSRYYDVHWQPYYHICSPCLVEYDFIGKMETLMSDVSCVLSKLNMSSWFPQPNSARSSVNLLKKKFEEVPLNLIYEIDHIYDQDTDMFGYKPLVERNYRYKDER